MSNHATTTVTLALLAGASVAACGPASTRCDGTVRAYDGYVDGDLCAGAVTTPGTGPLSVERIVDGLDQPVWAGSPPGDVGRLFIVEQRGVVWIVEGVDSGTGTLVKEPFLSITGRVSCCGEQGLLSVAFHPEYRDNGRFFVYYTGTLGDVVISEFQTCPDAYVADATSERILLRVNEPFSNHNGGQLQFGPDGLLYAGLGDGGSGGDPQENGQDLTTLLGKMLRLDVDGAEPYVIPGDNPFAGGGGEPEIWSYGLRNPWRFSFDRATGDLWIGDVGQNAWEEIDVALASTGGGSGVNWGWDDCEGDQPFEADCAGSEPPVLVYDHAAGCSVTGGFVYRGCAMPDLRGTYFYGDYCTAFTRSLVLSGGAATAETDHTADLAASGLNIDLISSYGEDGRGELYVVDYTGEVLRIVP